MTPPRPDLRLLVRISTALAAQAGRTRLVADCGRFIAIIDRRTEAAWASFALPDPGQWRAGPLDTHAALPLLQEIFSSHSRHLRFEFFEDLWPGLGGELGRAGYTAGSRQPILVCDAGSLVSRPAAGISVKRIGASDCDDRLAHFLRIQAEASGEGRAGEGSKPGPADIGRMREELLAGAQVCCLGSRGDEPAGAGSAMVAGDVCEIAAIATLPRWRGQGVASAVCAALAREHFARGGTLAWLTAGDEAAAGVYQDIGFRLTGWWQASCARPLSR